MNPKRYRGEEFHFSNLGPLLAMTTRFIGFVRSSPLIAIPSLVLSLILITALLAEVVSTHSPLEQDVPQRLSSPGANHYFGTDGFGRDVFSRVIYGTRGALYIGLLAVTLAGIFGIWLGTLSAYYRGAFDLVFQRVVDVLLGFPLLVLALVMVLAIGSSTNSVAIAIALAIAPQVSRLSRAIALSTIAEPYLDAARALGASPTRIIWKYLLPSSFPTILAQLTGYLGTAIVAETTLSYLGLGVPPPEPSWGRMLQEGSRQYFEVAPWVTIFPGIALSLTVLNCALLGDAIRDLYSPRT